MSVKYQAEMGVDFGSKGSKPESVRRRDGERNPAATG